jgi:hypothetical protein
MYLAQDFGKVVYITAKNYQTPKTYWNSPTYDEEGIHMRYWSWTIGNERTTGAISGGLSDQMFVEDEDGWYHMVISKPEDRPASATQECGYTWLNFNRRGDGSGRDGITTLVMRNILVNKGLWSPDDTEETFFPNSLQSVCKAATEQEVMGEYYPQGTYYADAAAFEEAHPCLR